MVKRFESQIIKILSREQVNQRGQDMIYNQISIDYIYFGKTDTQL